METCDGDLCYKILFLNYKSRNRFVLKTFKLVFSYFYIFFVLPLFAHFDRLSKVAFAGKKNKNIISLLSKAVSQQRKYLREQKGEALQHSCSPLLFPRFVTQSSARC